MSLKPKITERFKWFLEECDARRFENPLDIPVDIWGEHGWELIDKKKVEEILLPFMRYNIKRAKEHMPIYKKPYNDIDPKKIETIEDFYHIPALVKDSSVHGVGFREKVHKDPYVMLPDDIKTGIHVFKSGGTRGVAAPIFITNKDINIETEALKRSFEYEGMKPGDVGLSTYNPTHKGGEEIKETFVKLGMISILRRTTDTANDVIQTIRDYNVNVLLTTQGPIKEGDKQQKGGGISLLDLVEVGNEILEEKIEILFLGGYKLIPEAIAWAESHKKPLVTTLGSCEAIPQATNTNMGSANRICKHNNLHILNGPHYMEIVKEENGILVPVKKGDSGIYAYTTVAREGTILIRYFPGDEATFFKNQGECSCGLKSEIINNVHRIDIPTDVIEAGCCIG